MDQKNQDAIIARKRAQWTEELEAAKAAQDLDAVKMITKRLKNLGTTNTVRELRDDNAKS